MDRETAEPTVDEIPGSKATEWVDYHHLYSAPSTAVYGFVWDITRDAEGPFCTDIDGNILMDFTSHVAAAPLGYNNPKIIDKFREFDLVDPLKIAGQDFYVSGSGPTESPDFPGPPQLMDRLIDITSHYNLNTVFLSNSGAESVENALKICYDNRPSAKYGITFTGAFHGRTIGTLSLNRSKSEHRSFYPEISAIHDVPFCENSACDRESCECGFFPSSGKSLLRQKLEQPSGHIDPDEVAYLIIEPIQGEGGYRFPSDTFMEEIGDICDTYNIPIIVDEIQAGLGRTGRMWGCDHYSIDPDVITAAKGLRVGATISTQDIFPDTKGRISSTWGGGDIISSFLGVLTLDAIEEYNLMQNAINQGNSFTERLLDRDLPEFVHNPRNKGLMIAVDFDTKKRRDAVLEACLNRGLLILGCGSRTVRILPPLDVTDREISIGVDVFREAVTDPAVRNIAE